MMHIGVDIEGTFTDCVAVDRDGRRSIANDALAMRRGAGRVAGLPSERVYRVHGSWDEDVVKASTIIKRANFDSPKDNVATRER